VPDEIRLPRDVAGLLREGFAILNGLDMVPRSARIWYGLEDLYKLLLSLGCRPVMMYKVWDGHYNYFLELHCGDCRVFLFMFGYEKELRSRIMREMKIPIKEVKPNLPFLLLELRGLFYIYLTERHEGAYRREGTEYKYLIDRVIIEKPNTVGALVWVGVGYEAIFSFSNGNLRYEHTWTYPAGSLLEGDKEKELKPVFIHAVRRLIEEERGNLIKALTCMRDILGNIFKLQTIYILY